MPASPSCPIMKWHSQNQWMATRIYALCNSSIYTSVHKNMRALRLSARKPWATWPALQPGPFRPPAPVQVTYNHHGLLTTLLCYQDSDRYYPVTLAIANCMQLIMLSLRTKLILSAIPRCPCKWCSHALIIFPGPSCQLLLLTIMPTKQ